jgi:hypothetical protein
MNIPPIPSNPPQLNKYFVDLLTKYVLWISYKLYRCDFSSFFIIQHPSPSITTYRGTVNGSVKAKINCRVICLLDRSQPNITIDNISKYSQDNLIDNA